MSSLSIVQMVRIRGYSGTSKDHWAIGAMVSSRYTGPIMWDGRPKTDPNPIVDASQHVRVYPNWFAPIAYSIIEDYFFAQAQQLNLFGDDT